MAAHNIPPSGVAFSENSKLLYVSSMSYVYQFDVTAANIPSTKIIVAINDTFSTPRPPFFTTFYLAQLAPDGKIYINTGNGTNRFHVINYPNRIDTSCNLCQHFIVLPTWNDISIPNYVNYFLSADSASICDSLSSVPFLNNSNSITVFPNPALYVLYCVLNKNMKIKIVKIFNMIGQEMDTPFTFLKNGEYLEVNTFTLSQGIYFLELFSEKETVVKKFVKE